MSEPLVVTGDGRARGLAQGEHLREAIHEVLERVIDAMGGPAQVDAFIENTRFRDAIATHTPDLLAEFEALGPPPAPKRFVDGERLPYLGRSYALALVDRPSGSGAPFALRRGRFELSRGLDGEARAAAVAWYTARAQALIEADVQRYAPVVGASPDAVVVRDLGKRRWGVCASRTRTVSFHWELVLLSPDLIDYVVVHELAHLHEPNHGPRFWRRVEEVMPDWRARRARLAACGPRQVV